MYAHQTPYSKGPMIKYKAALELALKLEGVSGKDHFGGEAICSKKKIFATFWADKNEVNVLLPLEIQKEITEDSKAFKPVPNAWGRKGWTTISLAQVDKKTFLWALETALTVSMVKPSSPKTTNASRLKLK